MGGEADKGGVSEQGSLFTRQELDRPQVEIWERLKKDCRACTSCALSKSRFQAVFGEGCIERPPIAFVSDAPEYEEDKTGHQLLGKAGHLFDQMLAAVGLTRANVYVCTVVACRTPGNSDPEFKHILACRDYLVGQLRAIRPKVLVLFGNIAVHALLQDSRQITKLRGKWLEWQGIPALPTFHPKFLLKSPTHQKEALVDMRAAVTKAKEIT